MNNNSSRTIRCAVPDDAERLLEIYGYYVTNTSVTYEYDVPTVEEFRSRIEKTLVSYPYIVLEDEGRIIGYAYAGPFHPRAAYQWCTELTVYIDKNCRRSGAGKELYAALEDILKNMGFINLYACVAVPEKDDEYLTRNSLDFHRHLGFELVGEFKASGYKFGRWYNTVWLEKIVAPHSEKPEKIRPFHEIMKEKQ